MQKNLHYCRFDGIQNNHYIYIKMKKLVLLYAALQLTSVTISGAVNPGLQFQHVTDWCPHCKTMAETVYIDSALGAFFNANFICLKLDMEKEGREVALLYKISKYPGLLFLESNGDVVHRTTGEQKLPAMMQLGRDAIDPTKQYRTFERKFKDGTATKEEIHRFFIMQERAGFSSQNDLDKYFAAIPIENLTEPGNWRLIWDVLLDPAIPLMKTFIANKKAFEEKYSSDSVNMKIISVYNSSILKAAQQLDTLQVARLKANVRSSGLDISEKICAYADLNILRLKGDYTEYAKSAPSFVEQYCKSDARKMSEVAKEVSDRTYDTLLLAKAEIWSGKAVQLMDIYKHNYNYAYILQKVGKKMEALKVAKHAVEVGNKTGVDTKPTLLLIDKIEEMP